MKFLSFSLSFSPSLFSLFVSLRDNVERKRRIDKKYKTREREGGEGGSKQKLEERGKTHLYMKNWSKGERGEWGVGKKRERGRLDL